MVFMLVQIVHLLIITSPIRISSSLSLSVLHVELLFSDGGLPAACLMVVEVEDGVKMNLFQ
jgi:hypothetical protein